MGKKVWKELEEGGEYSHGAYLHFARWWGKKLGMKSEKWPMTPPEKYFKKREKKIGLFKGMFTVRGRKK